MATIRQHNNKDYALILDEKVYYSTRKTVYYVFPLNNKSSNVDDDIINIFNAEYNHIQGGFYTEEKHKEMVATSCDLRGYIHPYLHIEGVVKNTAHGSNIKKLH